MKAVRFLLLLGLTVPVFAQMDFAGDWAPYPDEDDIGNPRIGEYIGIPLSPASLLRSSAWSASYQTLPEWQCRPHGAMYISRGPSQVRIWKEVDPVTRQITAWHAEWLRSIDNLFYMDGRPHPSEYAAHTWGGFSTAEYQGEMLKIRTTHLKEDYYRRNGVPSSDKASLVVYWLRRGDDYLSWVTIAYDPVYLTEPMIRASEYKLTLNQQIPPYPCDVVEEVVRRKGVVPNNLPGKNDALDDFAKHYDLPMEATLGGAASMYPELARKIVREKNHVAAPRASNAAGQKPGSASPK
jgi:hypothetical protein